MARVCWWKVFHVETKVLNLERKCGKIIRDRKYRRQWSAGNYCTWLIVLHRRTFSWLINMEVGTRPLFVSEQTLRSSSAEPRWSLSGMIHTSCGILGPGSRSFGKKYQIVQNTNISVFLPNRVEQDKLYEIFKVFHNTTSSRQKHISTNSGKIIWQSPSRSTIQSLGARAIMKRLTKDYNMLHLILDWW